MTNIGAVHPLPSYSPDQVVTSGEVRELGRLIRLVSEGLGVEPGTLTSDELGARVRGLFNVPEHLRAKFGALAEHRDQLDRERERLHRTISLAFGHEPGVLTTDELGMRARSLVAENQQRGTDRARLARERDALSGLLRGMARRVGEWRRTSAEHYAAFYEAHLELEHAQDGQAKPNLWFTKPSAEFPLEAHERADRERTSIGHAFPTLEWREQQLCKEPHARGRLCDACGWWVV